MKNVKVHGRMDGHNSQIIRSSGATYWVPSVRTKEETAAQLVVGSIDWVFRRLKKAKESWHERSQLRASNFTPPTFLFPKYLND